jgi:hypothetical protein
MTFVSSVTARASPLCILDLYSIALRRVSAFICEEQELTAVVSTNYVLISLTLAGVTARVQKLKIHQPMLD